MKYIIATLVILTLTSCGVPTESGTTYHSIHMEDKTKTPEPSLTPEQMEELKQFFLKQREAGGAHVIGISIWDAELLEAQQSQADSLEYLETSKRVHDTIDTISTWYSILKILTD